ncbi:DUF354 domain-containing protein [Helicobacter suis]|uniref:DUF354 domain-containing protein n=1 Tax=Helicobacter suis TaxID=104628 RepID=UPI0013D002E7|nr:DUF354 domain-containing protein [Helicobacter suis]
MIWLDIIDPKYVLFFKELLPLLSTEFLITTRSSPNYQETRALLDLYHMPYLCFGGRGESLEQKYIERLKRSRWFLKLFNKRRPDLLLVGASVEAVQSAFALQIPIAYFLDTPSLGSKPNAKQIIMPPTKLAKLSAPLADVIFAPFVVPLKAYKLAGVQEVIFYPFIDPVLWLKKPNTELDFRKVCGLNCKRPTLLLRQEEQAHYVSNPTTLFDASILALNELDVNLVILPRYSAKPLKKAFGNLKNVFILEQKFSATDLYAHSDIMLGGGGTMNLESCYYGLPTLSLRSLWLYHDHYLLKHQLMAHATTLPQVLNFVKNALLPYENQDIDSTRKNIQAKNHARAKKVFIKGAINFDFLFKAPLLAKYFNSP